MIQAAYLSIEVWREGGFSNDDWQMIDPTTYPVLPIPITGYALRFIVARDEGSLSTVALIDINSNSMSGDQITLTDAPNGKFRPSIAAATIAALPLSPTGDPQRPGTRLFCALLAQPPQGVWAVYAAGPFIVRG